MVNQESGLDGLTQAINCSAFTVGDFEFLGINVRGAIYMHQNVLILFLAQRLAGAYVFKKLSLYWPFTHKLLRSTASSNSTLALSIPPYVSP